MSVSNPSLVPKRQNVIDGLENIIISFYVKGMSVSDIGEQIREMYDFDVSTMTRQTPEDIKNAIAQTVPLKRIGEAEEIANAIVFLASSEASYISGAYLPVDGGVTIRK